MGSTHAGNGSSGSMYPAVQFGSTPKLGHRSASPVMSKLESIASSAVRAADKVHASLIIVYTHTGPTCAFWGGGQGGGKGGGGVGSCSLPTN